MSELCMMPAGGRFPGQYCAVPKDYEHVSHCFQYMAHMDPAKNPEAIALCGSVHPDPDKRYGQPLFCTLWAGHSINHRSDDREWEL